VGDRSMAERPKEKQIGRYTQTNLLQGLQGIGIAFFTRHLYWSREAVELSWEEVPKELKDVNNHLFIQAWVFPLYMFTLPYNKGEIMAHTVYIGRHILAKGQWRLGLSDRVLGWPICEAGDYSWIIKVKQETPCTLLH